MGWIYNILAVILATGGVGFSLFLLGYLSYSIVKRGKRKRLEKELKLRQLDTIMSEKYVKYMDDALKNEIDVAFKEQYKNLEYNENSTKTSSFKVDNNKIDNSEFSKNLSRRIMAILEKGLNLAEKGLDVATNKMNEKHKYNSTENTQNSVSSAIKNAIIEALSNDKTHK